MRHCKTCGKRLRNARKFCSRSCIENYVSPLHKFFNKLKLCRLSWPRSNASSAATRSVTD